MRIDLVSEHASPLAMIGGVDAGGQNVHVAALATALADCGASVVVHTRRDDPHLDSTVCFAENVVVHHVDAGPPTPIPKDELFEHMPAFADALCGWWRTDRPDVVHAHFWMSGYAAMLAASQDPVPVALTFHALGIEKRLHQGAADTSPSERIGVESELARSVDLVIATTSAERNLLVDMGSDPDRVVVVPCGVDAQTFTPDGPRWDNESGRKYIACASRLVPRKGISEVLRALPELPGVDLLVAGGPPEVMLGEDVEAQRLTHLAEQLGVSERVRFLGALGRDEIAKLYRGAEAVCCTPWYEPFGLVAVEAIACGTPVVATRVGGLAETIVDGETGRLVDPHDPQQIADAIEEIFDNPEVAALMGAGAHRRSLRYGWANVATSTMAAYAALMTTGARSARSTPTVEVDSARESTALALSSAESLERAQSLERAEPLERTA